VPVSAQLGACLGCMSRHLLVQSAGMPVTTATGRLRRDMQGLGERRGPPGVLERQRFRMCGFRVESAWPSLMAHLVVVGAQVGPCQAQQGFGGAGVYVQGALAVSSSCPPLLQPHVCCSHVQQSGLVIGIHLLLIFRVDSLKEQAKAGDVAVHGLRQNTRSRLCCQAIG